ncbi:MAG: ATP-binding protein [Roseburia sp.]
MKISVRRVKRFFCAALCVCLSSLLVLAGCPAKAYAEEETEETKTVRIGYFLDNDRFQSGGPGEERKSGYAYEYYQKIGEYTGWDYEYVYGTWSELSEKLVNGEVDIMAGFSISEERQDEMLFSAERMGRESYYIYAPSGSPEIRSKEPATLNGKKIGVTKGTVMEEMLSEYLEKQGVDSEIVLMDDYNQMHRDMVDGKLDACVLSDNFVESDVEQIALIGTSDLYFAVSPEREDLLEELDTAMERIQETSPYYMVLLQDKYFSDGLRQALTEEERSWLEEKGTIRFGYITDALPISGQKEDGTPAGVTEVILQNMEKFLGIEVEPIAYKSIDEMEEALQADELDAAFPSYRDLWRTENKGIYQTDYIVKDRVMLVFTGNYSEDLFNEIAISNNSIGQKYFVADNYPGAEVMYCEDATACFEAVKNEEIRCCIGCESILQRVMQENPKYAELNIAYLDDTEDFGIAVNGQEHLLVEMLNKMITQIDMADVTNSMIQHSYVETQYGLREFVEDNAIWFVSGLAVLATLLIGVFIAYRKNAEYTQRILTEAAEEAREASLAKTRFLSTMSHDIRTPMNVILGMTSIASKHVDDPGRVKDSLKKIALAGHHLLTLLNDVLDISKVESGKFTLKPSCFSLKNLADEICNNISFQAKEKALDFQMELVDIIYDELYADELRLNQIFINLLSNAVKYTPPHGSVQFLLWQEKLGDDEKRVRLICQVRDTGIGMSQEFMQTMYEPFARENNSRVDAIQGYGLGLAIIHQMVELMGGVIHCQSREGVGTTFSVILDIPIAKEQQECNLGSLVHFTEDWDEAAVQAVEFPNSAPVWRKKSGTILQERKILVAEDNDLNWEIMEEILGDYGISCDRAENGQICIDMLVDAPEDTYAAILMDIQMPLMDGREATRHIRALKDTEKAGIVIIAMTADAFAEDVSSCLECGMNGHLAKPVDEKQLIGMLRQMGNM